jgi:tetratricopeptide (TPR) repeat protein/transcriptional regulator with XRE-family HTH domain
VADGAGFGARLAACRQLAGLSQQDVAQRSGLSVRAVRDLERGRTRWPHPDSVQRLADALGLRDEARREFIAAAARRVAWASRSRAAAVPAGQPAPADGEQIVPRQLPGAVWPFVGRENELATLNGLLDDVAAGRPTGVVIGSIQGMAGIGKTALVVHWAHQVAGRFPDGQLYVNLRGFDPSKTPTPPAEAIRDCLEALPVPAERIPASLDAQASLYRSLLSGKRMLVVLDNARDAEQVRPLLPSSPGCLVVITSRRQLTGLAATEGACQLGLDLLTEAGARELLTARLGAARLAAEPDAAAELTGLCGGLPLALVIAAARVAARPGLQLSALTQELKDAQQRLDALDAGDAAASVRAVFACSVDSMPAPSARVFGLLGLHPGPDITVAAAASLAGIPHPQARRALNDLAEAHLITEHAPGRFSLHDLLRAYASERSRAADADAAPRAAIGRLAGYYVWTSRAATFLLNPAREKPALSAPALPPGVTPDELADDAQALAWFEAEHKTLLGVIEQAASTGFDTQAWLLSWSLADFLDRRGSWHEWAMAQQIALAAATRLGDLALQARAVRGLGRACTELGALEDARDHFRRALDLDRQLGNDVGQANTYLALARVAEYLGRYDEALGHARQALDLLRAADDTAGQARALNGLGWFHAQAGSYQEALACCEEALALYQRTEDRRGEATTCDSLGYAHARLGHQAWAITCYQRAVAGFVELGDHPNLAGTLMRLGDAQHAAGHHDQAQASWQRALALLDDLQDPSAAQVRAKLSEREPRDETTAMRSRAP